MIHGIRTSWKEWLRKRESPIDGQVWHAKIMLCSRFLFLTESQPSSYLYYSEAVGSGQDGTTIPRPAGCALCGKGPSRDGSIRLCRRGLQSLIRDLRNPSKPVLQFCDGMTSGPTQWTCRILTSWCACGCKKTCGWQLFANAEIAEFRWRLVCVRFGADGLIHICTFQVRAS